MAIELFWIGNLKYVGGKRAPDLVVALYGYIDLEIDLPFCRKCFFFISFLLNSTLNATTHVLSGPDLHLQWVGKVGYYIK